MEKIKVGLVGLGRIMKYGHIPILIKLKDQFEITAVCDNAPDRLQENIPEPVKNCRKYSTIDELLNDEDVELVIIGTRHPDHAPMAKKALAAGKYVLVEKPCAINYAEGKDLVDFAQNKYPGKLFLRHNRRYEKVFVKVRKLLKGGLLGKINMIKLSCSVGYQRRNDWMTMSKYAGGLLTNWGPHIIDQALQLLDSPVKDIWADIKSVISVGDSDDHVKLLLKAENDCVADIEIVGDVAYPYRKCEVWGDRGSLICSDEKEIRMRYVDPDIKFKKLAPHEENPEKGYGNFDEKLTFVEQRIEVLADDFSELQADIYNDIKKNIPYPITLEQGLEVIRITDLALKKSGFVPRKK
ncbi:MAG: Gfo/Idh/MocA family oxidoreductase [Lentisphaeria bacterium]